VRVLLAAAALMGAGCVPHPDSTPPPDAAPGHGAPIPNEEPPCNAGPPEVLLGRVWSPALEREAQRLAGARAIRTLRPGQVVTMEFRMDRLNLHLNAQEKIERINCG